MDDGSLSLAADNVELSQAEAGAIPGARSGHFVVLLVSDTGTGIPADVLPKVFEPFFTTKPESRGTGLGLSTTARIVKAHHGFIGVHSQPGAGTTFEIYLPRYAEAAPDAGAAEALPPPRGHGELILVADDDEAVRELLRRSLEDFGYRVITAAHGAEAVSIFKAQSHEVALFLSDRSMPLLDGLQAVAALREMGAVVPVLLLSGEGDLPAPPEGTEPPNIEHLSKPIDLDSLLRAVGAALEDGRR